MSRSRVKKTHLSVGQKDVQMGTPPASPIASKVRRNLQEDDDSIRRIATMNVAKQVAKPGMVRKDSTNEVFSPAKWRSDSRDETGASADEGAAAGKLARQKASALPRGDPLGVLYTMLEDDPEILHFMNTIPRKVPARFARRPADIPAMSPTKRRQFKNTLVLDLDETLVHCTTEASEVVGKPDAVFQVTFNGVDYTVYMSKRPYLEKFLDQVKKWFEVVVFTASQKCYADRLLKIIDPDGSRIQHSCFRESCAHYMDNFLKPLGILGRNEKNVFIVDNSPQVFSFEPNNGIPCTSWFDDQRDNELMRLLPYLRDMKDLDDVRPYLRSTFGVADFLDYLRKEANGSFSRGE